MNDKENEPIQADDSGAPVASPPTGTGPMTTPDTIPGTTPDTMPDVPPQTPQQTIRQATPVEEAKGVEPAQVAEQAAEPEPVRLPLPGAILAAKRQERRLSVDEVSARIKLAPRQIAALEADDFAALPGMATTRGFIRSYARLLELDPTLLLAALADEPNPAFAPLVIRRPLPSPEFSGRRYAPPTSHRRDARRLPALAAVMLVFVGTLAFVGYRQEWLTLPSIELPAPVEPVAPSSEQEALPPPEAPAAVADNAPVTPAPAPASALQLVAREDAWVEVVVIDGERKLISKLMKAGSTELVEIAEPVILVVGNAAGVDAVLRGQSLNLRAAARDNVAKLSLK